MLRSEGRILTTHAGSLPRRESLIAMLVKSSRGEDVDCAAMLREIEISTRHVVQSNSKRESTSATTASNRARASSPTCSIE